MARLGKRIALISTLVCILFLAIAFPVLGPEAVDYWAALRLGSKSLDARKRAVRYVCHNPSPRAARKLMRLFVTGDEAANVAMLLQCDIGLVPFVLDAARNAGRTLLERIEPLGVDGAALRDVHGLGTLTELEELLKATVNPSIKELQLIAQAVQVVTGCLHREGLSVVPGDIEYRGDPELMVLLLALFETHGSTVCVWYGSGVRSSHWFVRMLALDALLETPCAGADTDSITLCLHDENQIVRCKAVDVLIETATLPADLIDEVAALLMGSPCRTAASALLSIPKSDDHAMSVLIEALSDQYAKYLSEFSDAPDPSESEFVGEGADFMSLIDSIVLSRFDCGAVSDLVERLSLPPGQCEFSVHALAKMECKLPDGALSLLKRFLKDPRYSVRLHAIYASQNLITIDEEMVRLVLSALADPNATMRGASLLALSGRIGGDLALQVFTSASTDPSQYCRRLAVSALADLGELARDRLEEFIVNAGETDADLIRIAREAIKRLDGR